MSERLLVVGCGLRPKAGAVNLDKVALPGVDVVMDLDTIGNQLSAQGSLGATVYAGGKIPYADRYFDRIEAEDVLEHVNDPIIIVQELGRVLRIGGVLFVRGPDAEWVWHDLTHKRAFSERSFDGFCPDTYDGKHYGHYHGAVKFRMLSKRHVNHGWEYTMERLP